MHSPLDARRQTGLLVGFLIANIILIVISPVSVGLSLLGIAIIGVSLLPVAADALYPQERSIPFFPMVGIFYAVFFGLPLFTINLAWPNISSILLYSRAAVGEIQPRIIGLAVAGIAALVTGFFFGSRLMRRMPALKFPVFVEAEDLAPLYVALLVVHQAERFFPGWTGIPSLIQLSEPLGYVGLGGLFLEWRRGRFSGFGLVVFVGLFLPIEIYLRIRILYLSDLLLLLIFFVFLLWRERLFKWVVAGLAGCIVVSSLYGVTTVVRYSAPEGLSRIALAAKAYVVQFVQGSDTLEARQEEGGVLRYEFWGRFGSLVMRTGHLWVFHVVADRSPDPVPYWNGETYRPLLTSAIPRVFYPSKPEERSGLEFGRRYGFLTSDQTGTSINIPWLVELLANFGPIGVVVGMPIFGFLLAVLDRLFNRRHQGDAEFLVGLTLLTPLVYPESNFSVMTGSMLPLFLALCGVIVGGAYILRAIRRRLFGHAVA